MRLLPPPLLRILLPVGVGLLSALPAAGLTFSVDPTRSTLSVSGEATFDLGLGPPEVNAITSQLASAGAVAAGAVGAVLPDGSTSDGLTTALSGSLEASVQGDQVALAGASFSLATSGSWLPQDAFGGVGGVAPGQLAGRFSETFGAIGVFRGLELELAAVVLETSVLGGGALDFGAGSVGSYRASAGQLDFLTSGGGSSAIVPQVFVAASLVGGSLTPVGGGVLELRLPVSLALPLSQSDLGLAFPASLDLTLTGEIVALSTVIPEPGTGLLVALGLAGLAGRGRARR